MSALSHVLVATDLSAAADEALRRGDRWAKENDATLEICHVVPVALEFGHFDRGLIDDVTRRTTNAVKERALKVTGRDASHFSILIRFGAPSVSIAALAKERHSDLVVVGGHGTRTTGLGRTAEMTIRRCECPVLVAKPFRQTKVILAATDFSDPDVPAVRSAYHLAHRRGGEVAVMNCFSGDPEPYGRLQAQHKIDACLMKLHLQGQGIVASGPPAQEIVRIAKERGVEMVCVGARAKSSWSLFNVDDVAEKVARDADCPVLVVRLREPSHFSN